MTVITAQTARLALSDALDARLDTLPGLTVYPGEVPDKPPLIQAGRHPDPAHRVAPYAVTYPGPGAPDINPSLAALPADFLWDARVTFAAGYKADLMHTLDRAIPLLQLWSPTITGLVCGHMRPPEGTRLGPILRDDDVTPPRFYAVTAWELHVATAGAVTA